MKYFFHAFIIVLVAGCNNNPAETKLNSAHLDLPKHAQDLAINMAGRELRISKTFVLNETSETKEFSKSGTVFWKNELAILENIDLNSPQLIGAFDIEKGVQDQFSNLLIDKYSFAAKGDIGIKKLHVYYLEDPNNIRQIKAETATKNLISQSNSQLSIWINRYGEVLLIDSLEIISEDKTLMQPSRNYRSITTVER